MKYQIDGQIDMFKYLSGQISIGGCGPCVCRKCMYWWSSRCPYGSCFDDERARTDPYDKAHADKSPRTGLSNCNKPGEQAHWCRGGICYPVFYCRKFVKYEGSVIEECIGCNIQVFQDGHISCYLKDTIGCESCISENEGRNLESTYDCQYMTDTGCSRMITAKNLILDEIMSGGVIEMCKEQCCRGCIKVCEYRCGQ